MKFKIGNYVKIANPGSWRWRYAMRHTAPGSRVFKNAVGVIITAYPSAFVYEVKFGNGDQFHFEEKELELDDGKTYNPSAMTSQMSFVDDWLHDFENEKCRKCGMSRVDINYGMSWTCDNRLGRAAKDKAESVFKPVQVHPPVAKENKCTCGAHKVLSNHHSPWCDWRPDGA